jgi:hypothetical protein
VKFGAERMTLATVTHAVDMGERIRTQLGSALPPGETQSAPSPPGDADEESMSMGIRSLLLGWGGKTERVDDEERLASLRRGRSRETQRLKG